jgi:hypothetical protein
MFDDTRNPPQKDSKPEETRNLRKIHGQKSSRKVCHGSSRAQHALDPRGRPACIARGELPVDKSNRPSSYCRRPE